MENVTFAGQSKAPSALRADGLRVETPHGQPIIDSVSFAVAKSEILGIVGESGSGKTTSALALLGMAHPGAILRAGTVTADGRTIDITDPKAIRLLRGHYLSYVPQSPGTALNPVMRVSVALKEMVEQAPESQHPKPADWDHHIGEVLDKVELPRTRDFLRRFPHQLSGGQQQRVCIAVSLLAKANVLILDEPTTGLDVITQAAVLDELKRLRAELHLSMIYISHDLAVVSQIADRVMVMREGSIVEAGPVDEVLHSPTHYYTRILVASTLDYRHPVAGDLKVSAREGADNAPISRAVPVLAVEDLTVEHVTHGKVVASVNDVSFQIETGECLALLGESGSGKSTIARSVVGLKPLTSGSVNLDGAALAPRVNDRTDEQRRRLQIIFQNSSAALNPRENVRTAIERARRLQSTRQQSGRSYGVEELLGLVRLPASFQYRLPRELSGGERQRVCIARALASSPDVIVCDEITSALDVSVQASVLKLLKEIQRDLGLSLLFITHNMGVVSYLADDVVVLDRGRVCESGSTTRVLHTPESSYVQRLMDAVPSLGSVKPFGHDA